MVYSFVFGAPSWISAEVQNVFALTAILPLFVIIASVTPAWWRMWTHAYHEIWEWTEWNYIVCSQRKR